MRVAAAAYPLDWFEDWQAYEAKLKHWVHEAAQNRAELLVFPEYGSIELASIYGEAALKDIHKQAGLISDLKLRVDALHTDLARAYKCHIVAASLPVRIADDRAFNRARLFAPNGKIGVQDKLILTPFEREEWHIEAGRGVQLFDTALGKIGICICYDAEFPLIARALAEAGAEIIAVPSCTHTMAGFSRVRIGAMARALENQLFTIHASTVGDFASPAVETNVGTGSIYGPPDGLTTPTGIIAEGKLNVPGWTYADLDMETLRRVRASGEVRNVRDWPEQTPHLGGPANIVELR